MAKAAANASATKKAPTKSEILNNIATATNLAKKDVASVFEALAAEIKKHVSGKGAGVFTIPGLVKVTRKKVAARPAQKGVKNPFTGELQDRPARPAYNKIAVRALKSLKDMA
jgi:nucleoid DNA-binding protein